MRLLLVTVLLLSPLLTIKAAEAPYGLQLGRYHALIISNQDYRNLAPLRTPHGDANALAELLRRDYGFKITALRDANRASTLDALDQLVERLTPNDNLLIFYAGHGHLDKATGEGYWLPVTANPRRRSEWISNSDISDTLRATAARHVLVISDSCFSGTLSRNAVAGLSVGQDKYKYFSRLASRISRTALSSGGLEPVDDGGGKGHSVFAGALIATLERNNEPLLEAESLYSQIKRPVALNSSATQKPQYSDVRSTGHDEGDFLFFKRNVRVQPQPSSATPAQPGTVNPDAAYELSFWDTVKDSKDVRDFQAYLESYPQGRFAALARLRVNQLARPVAPVPIEEPMIEQASVSPGISIKSQKPLQPVASAVPTLSSAKTVFIIRATPDQEYSPEFSTIEEYSNAVAGIMKTHYAGDEVAMVTDATLSESVIFESSEYPVSKRLCQQYSAQRLLTLELNLSRDVDELTRTPDVLYLSTYDCARQQRSTKEYEVDFQLDEKFTYAVAVEKSIQNYNARQ